MPATGYGAGLGPPSPPSEAAERAGSGYGSWTGSTRFATLSETRSLLQFFEPGLPGLLGVIRSVFQMQHARPAIDGLPGEILVPADISFNFSENLIHGCVVIGPLNEPSQKADELFVRRRGSGQVLLRAILAFGRAFPRFHSPTTQAAPLPQHFCGRGIGVAHDFRDCGYDFRGVRHPRLHEGEVGSDFVLLGDNHGHQTFLVQSVVARPLRAIGRQAHRGLKAQGLADERQPLLAAETIGGEKNKLRLQQVLALLAVSVEHSHQRCHRTLDAMDEDQGGGRSFVSGNDVPFLSGIVAAQLDTLEWRRLFAGLRPRKISGCATPSNATRNAAASAVRPQEIDT